MAATPFHSIPKHRFLAKMLVPLAAAFALGVALMGQLADPDVFQPKPLKSANGVVMELPDNLKAISQSGIRHWQTILYFATHVPEVCWGDNAVNEFQKKQCGEFWEHLEMGAGLCAVPFVATWVFWMLIVGALRKTYREARHRIQSGKPIVGGVVTDPAQAPGDLFSWTYCLRPIGVQLPNGKQLKVYIPLDAPEPRPGLTMAVFEPLTAFGEPRHFAMIYAPHVAVVSGVRRA